ncbi:unnamed protein product [Penicillium salamii]|uniref:Nucleoside phosphorylase domain-containing protein n=1 Tax=Penicillium salamii TaxID=1612424 RepID=A0A9W4JIU9_9EURO|nr:unnamed protein product [Penicillium salamii]CAG8106055.1 unnamed protein product [Penicillium salamii]CAG8276339.1 unnamed protein product [Penicillium salamii]CAG8282898.1 unnamed protein product [Penicillium salamii]CAG8332812.1 unnamed protein product [Penicillium salamii]
MSHMTATAIAGPPAVPAAPAVQEFMIGWICVLRAEYRAALAILDERYDTKSVVRGSEDKNQYVLGRVGPHNVIINLPPVGLNGPVHAFSVARDMKSTFPRMRFTLLVGIAGGVPSLDSDIRLGDVVMGQKVVPYRTGKETQYGFQRTGMIKAPPSELLTTIGFLNDRIDMDGLDLSLSIEEARTKILKGGAAFLRPTSDRCYKVGVAHQEFGCDCLLPESLYPERLIHRSEREDDPVRVFLGAMGSDAAVMKNAQSRDAIAKREGIVCYEMESWAVMDLIPCLPIRGISDYADEHKNDAWHLYASLAAATCAREYLLALPQLAVRNFPVTIQGSEIERYIKGTTSNPNMFCGSGIEKLQQTRDHLRERRELFKELMHGEHQDSISMDQHDEGVNQSQDQTLNDLREGLKHHLKVLDQIMDQEDELGRSGDPHVRQKYMHLKHQIRADRMIMRDLADLAPEGVEYTGEWFENAGDTFGNKSMRKTGRLMTSTGQYFRKMGHLFKSKNLTPKRMWRGLRRGLRGAYEELRRGWHRTYHWFSPAQQGQLLEM